MPLPWLDRTVDSLRICLSNALSPPSDTAAQQQADRIALLQVVQLTQRWAEQKACEQDGLLEAVKQEVAELRAERTELHAAITSQAAMIIQLRETVTALVSSRDHMQRETRWKK